MAEANEDSKEPIHNSFDTSSNRDSNEIKKSNSKKDIRNDISSVQKESDSGTVTEKKEFKLNITVNTCCEQHPGYRNGAHQTAARGNAGKPIDRLDEENDTKENTKETSKDHAVPLANQQSNITSDSDGLCQTDKIQNQVLLSSKHKNSQEDEQESNAQDTLANANLDRNVEGAVGPVLTDKQASHSLPLSTYSTQPSVFHHTSTFPPYLSEPPFVPSAHSSSSSRLSSLPITPARGPAPSPSLRSSRPPTPGAASRAEASDEQPRTNTQTGPPTPFRLRGHVTQNSEASSSRDGYYSHVVELGRRTVEWDHQMREPRDRHVEILHIVRLEFRPEERDQSQGGESTEDAEIRRIQERELLALEADLRMLHLIRVFQLANQDPDAGRLCLRCRDQEADIMTFFCRHLVLCHACVNVVDQCPVCSAPIRVICRLN